MTYYTAVLHDEAPSGGLIASHNNKRLSLLWDGEAKNPPEGAFATPSKRRLSGERQSAYQMALFDKKKSIEVPSGGLFALEIRLSLT